MFGCDDRREPMLETPRLMPSADPQTPPPEHLSRQASKTLAAHRRGRNLLLLAVLLGLVVLFYLLAIVKLSHPGATPP
jgi:hypothetical protein